MANSPNGKNATQQYAKYLYIVLIILLLMNAFLGYKYIKGKYFRYDPDYTYDRKSLFEKLSATIDTSSIVFMGNSLTAQFELAELFKNTNIRNRGINGDYSSGMLGRLSAITPFHPKKIFIEGGVNDIKDKVPNEMVLDNFKKILARIKEQSAGSKLYVQSILPVNSKGGAVTSSGLKNETIVKLNEELEAYCKQSGITFINLYKHFELNGEMDPKYCIADGLHISGEGYLLWATLLKEYVEE